MKKEVSLLKRYTDFNDRLKARGVEFSAFNCPSCDEQIETQVAPAGERWDTIAECPYCNTDYVKITEGARAYGVPLTPRKKSA